MKRGFQLAVGVALAALFLWLTLRDVGAMELQNALRGISVPWLLMAPILLAFGHLCRIWRWHMMLRRHNSALAFGRSAVAFTGSIAVNNLLPLRAGDALRALGFTRWLGVASGSVTATVVVERLLDLVTLILALALALWAFSLGADAVGLARSGSLILALVAGTCLLLLLHPRLLGSVISALSHCAGLFGPGVREGVERFTKPLRATLTDLSGRHVMPTLVLWSLPVWAFEGACYWAIAQGLPTLNAPLGAWLAMPVGTLSTLLPSTPGHIGTFDYFTQTAMRAAGNPLAPATAFVLITHATLWLCTTLTGGVCLMVWLLRRGGTASVGPG